MYVHVYTYNGMQNHAEKHTQYCTTSDYSYINSLINIIMPTIFFTVVQDVLLVLFDASLYIAYTHTK